MSTLTLTVRAYGRTEITEHAGMRDVMLRIAKICSANGWRADGTNTTGNFVSPACPVVPAYSHGTYEITQ
jgi:hypothetical protein